MPHFSWSNHKRRARTPGSNHSRVLPPSRVLSDTERRTRRSCTLHNQVHYYFLRLSDTCTAHAHPGIQPFPRHSCTGMYAGRHTPCREQGLLPIIVCQQCFLPTSSFCLQQFDIFCSSSTSRTTPERGLNQYNIHGTKNLTSQNLTSQATY